jgi:hypothetical protein
LKRFPLDKAQKLIYINRDWERSQFFGNIAGFCPLYFRNKQI